MLHPTPRAPHTRPRTPRGSHPADPAPLSARQLRELIAATIRELTWGLGRVAAEVRAWRAYATTIADPATRQDALKAIAEQRGHIDGAALFSILPAKRHPALLELLVAYEVIWDYLDNVNERTITSGVGNGLQLHLALTDALDHRSPPSDYYKHSPPCDENGYLRALVTACQARYTRLPSSAEARDAVIIEATRGQVCAINHDPDPDRRDAALQGWALADPACTTEASWFELTAAASTNLTVFALLALASERSLTPDLIKRTSHAYFPWISVLCAMLDSYADQDEDTLSGDHSYMSHYPTPDTAIERTCTLIRRCMHEASRLPSAEKHAVIAGCMFAMYLSKDSTINPRRQATTRRMIDGGGTLTRLLHPILRLWRTAYGLRSA